MNKEQRTRMLAYCDHDAPAHTPRAVVKEIVRHLNYERLDADYIAGMLAVLCAKMGDELD